MPVSRTHRRGLALEPLEARHLLAVFTVTNLADAGQGSLRRAIQRSNESPGIDTVAFSSDLSGQSILLTTGEIAISQVGYLDASSLAEGITIDAAGSDPTPNLDDGNGSRVFRIAGPGDFFFDISGVTLRGGDVTGNGGAIFSEETLRLNDSLILDSHASDSGGGIFAASLAQIVRSEISGNRAGQNGGGLAGDSYDVPVRLTDTFVRNNSAAALGGGVFLRLSNFGPGADNAEFSMDRSEISENSSGQSGGGLFLSARNGTFDIANSLISGNASAATGGGAYFFAYGSGNPQLRNTSVTSNTADGSAGGLYWNNSAYTNTLEVTDSSISGNQSAVNGGGIDARGSILVERSVLHRNEASGDGGGLHLQTGYRTGAHIRQATISGNVAKRGGGIFQNTYEGGILIEQSTVTDNEAAENGGGAYLIALGSFTQVSDSTFSGNRSAGNGGGIHAIVGYSNIEPTDFTLVRSTITNNVADANGTDSVTNATGGLYLAASPVIHETINNNIIAKNFQGSSGDVPALDVFATVETPAEFNLIGTLTDSIIGDSNLWEMDPRLGPLLGNGGPTSTHALLVDSPAIDAGDPLGPAVEFDQRGTPFGRVQDGDGDGNSRLDIGAFELQGNNVAPLADAGPDVTVRAGFPTQLDGSASLDPDDGPADLSYAWELLDGPGPAWLFMRSDPIAEFSSDTPGEYTVRLTVFDGLVSHSDEMIVTVTANRIPLADASLSDATGSVGLVVILDATRSSDPDGDMLGFQWTLLAQPAGSNVSINNSQQETASFIPSRIGVYRVQLVVNDGFDDSLPVEVSIPINDGVDNQWHHLESPLDVDRSGTVSPLDALLVINELTDRLFSNPVNGVLNSLERPPDAGSIDVTNDGIIAPLDALNVINGLPTSANLAASAAASPLSSVARPAPAAQQTTWSPFATPREEPIAWLSPFAGWEDDEAVS